MLRFPEHRITVRSGFSTAAKDLGRLLPGQVYKKFRQALEQNLIHGQCGVVELTQYGPCGWAFACVDGGYAIIFTPAAKTSKEGFSIIEAIRLERRLCTEQWYRSPYWVAPYTPDLTIQAKLAEAQSSGKHWSLAL